MLPFLSLGEPSSPFKLTFHVHLRLLFSVGSSLPCAQLISGIRSSCPASVFSTAPQIPTHLKPTSSNATFEYELKLAGALHLPTLLHASNFRPDLFFTPFFCSFHFGKPSPPNVRKNDKLTMSKPHLRVGSQV